MSNWGNIADLFLTENAVGPNARRMAIHTRLRPWTYADVDALANRWANALIERGFEREQRVLLAMADGPGWVGAFFGILKAGGVVVMLNPHLSPDNLTRIFDYTAAQWLLADASVKREDGPVHETYAAAVRASTSRPKMLVVGTDLLPEFPHANTHFQSRRTHLDDPAIWLFSGGTTGAPKAVIQTHRSFLNTTLLYAQQTLGYTADDIVMAVPKLFFGYATGSALLFPFSVGASTVLFPEHPTPELLFEKLQRHRPTILINVPKMIQQMVQAAEELDQPPASDSLRFATSAGEALPAPLYERWKETFGCELYDGLGTAEMWHIFLTNRPGAVVPGTLGQPVEGFDVRVRDEDGQDLPAGEVGRLWVAGDSRAIGYWRNAAKSAEVFRGRWVVTGDLVSRDEEGFFTYHGRSDDVLKVSGKWLAPKEVEDCLAGHPQIERCAVIGVENESGLTEPVAFVLAPDSDLDEGSVQQYVLERLEPYKHPRRVIFVDEFPLTHLGKIDRNALRQSLDDGSEEE